MNLIFLLACTTDPATEDTGGKTEDASSSCDGSEAEILPSTVSPLGFSADEVLAWLDGEHVTTLVFSASNETSDLSVTVASDGTASFVDLEPAASSGGIEPAIEELCADSLELGATVDFVTAGGELVESWALRLVTDQVAAAGIAVEVETDGLGGSYVVPTDLTSGCDTHWLSFNLWFSQGSGTSGELDLLCENVDGETASLGMDQVAVWGEGEFE